MARWAEAAGGQAGAGAGAGAFAPLMDGLDVGLVLIGPQAQVVHVNPAAREVLRSAGCPLQILGEQLFTADEAEQAALQQALKDCRSQPLDPGSPALSTEAAQPGKPLGVLLFLGQGPRRISLAITPLGDWQLSMLTLGRSRPTAVRLAHNFARVYGLTPTETRVLAALCEGGSPETIAAQHDVEVSTVRTQLARLRNRTQSRSMRELLAQVFSLPPVMAELSGSPQTDADAEDDA